MHPEILNIICQIWELAILSIFSLKIADHCLSVLLYQHFKLNCCSIEPVDKKRRDTYYMGELINHSYPWNIKHAILNKWCAKIITKSTFYKELSPLFHRENNSNHHSHKTIISFWTMMSYIVVYQNLHVTCNIQTITGFKSNWKLTTQWGSCYLGFTDLLISDGA